MTHDVQAQERIETLSKQRQALDTEVKQLRQQLEAARHREQKALDAVEGMRDLWLGAEAQVARLERERYSIAPGALNVYEGRRYEPASVMEAVEKARGALSQEDLDSLAQAASAAVDRGVATCVEERPTLPDEGPTTRLLVYGWDAS